MGVKCSSLLAAQGVVGPGLAPQEVCRMLLKRPLLPLALKGPELLQGGQGAILRSDGFPFSSKIQLSLLF